MTPILVTETARLDFLPRLFGDHFLMGEILVFRIMENLTPAYSGGFWDFYDLPGGSGFMIPDMEGPLEISWEGNGYEGTVSTKVAGIIATAHVLAQYAPDNYHLLMDYAETLPKDEKSAIFAALD